VWFCRAEPHPPPPPLGASLYRIEDMEIGWSDGSCVFDGSDSRSFNS